MTQSTQRVLVLIDGTNMVHAAAFRDAGAVLAMDRFVDTVASWAALRDVDVVVAVDGSVGVVRATVGDRVQVVTSAPTDADSVLERRAAECAHAGRSWWIATDDGELRRVAGGGADRVLRSDDLARELRSVHAREPDTAEQVGAGRRLDQDVDSDTRAALERLRRGL